MDNADRIIVTLKTPEKPENGSIDSLIRTLDSDEWDSRDVSVQADSTLSSFLDYIGMQEGDRECYNKEGQKLDLGKSFIANQIYNGSILIVPYRKDDE